MNVTIRVDRVKELRARSGKSQGQIARAANIGPRHLKRIEGTAKETCTVQEKTLLGLARGFKVPPEVLKGEADIPEDYGNAASAQATRTVRQTTIRLDARSTLNYDLLERRYGVSLQDVANIAPLLFAIHAEQSLRRRRRLNKAHMASIEQLIGLAETFPNLKSIVGYPDSDTWFEESDEHLSEAASIESHDIFADQVRNDFPGDSSPNPFVAHLDEILDDLNDPALAQISRFEDIPFDAVMYFPGDRIPSHEVCRSDLLEISGSDPEALFALTFGVVRLQDIPADLMPRDRLVERVTWLRDAFRSSQSNGESAKPEEQP